MMPPLLRFILSRIASILITLLIITALLYGFVMLTPPETRVLLYTSAGADPIRLSPRQLQILIDTTIRRYHLRDPYIVQYSYWALNLLKGDWGWSPVLGDDVLSALLRRTPVTAELTFYSVLLFIPLGLASGVIAGWKKGRGPDYRFRFAAFIATSLPTFILALVLMAIFYVGLGWFPPERLGIKSGLIYGSDDFKTFTGFITIDGLLNGMPDISAEAARHLVLPVFTLSLLHWATLGRVMRASMVEELQREYIVAGKAHGVPERVVVWRHAFRNSLSPALTSSALSAASLITGVFVVERIFGFRGISDVVVSSTRDIPDASAVLGFAIYSVILVLLIMLVLDMIQASLDPRVRRGVIK